MPHIFVEYSANLEEHFDMGEMLQNVHDAAASHPSVPLAGLRTRAIRRDDYLIANGNNANMFVAVIARLNGDRGQVPLVEVRDLLAEAVKRSIGDLSREQPIAISVEVQPIDAVMRVNENSIRDHYEELQ
jgi:5-carboxymethyl-2-hydroxymuconate isomerase